MKSDQANRTVKYKIHVVTTSLSLTVRTYNRPAEVRN